MFGACMPLAVILAEFFFFLSCSVRALLVVSKIALTPFYSPFLDLEKFSPLNSVCMMSNCESSICPS